MPVYMYVCITDFIVITVGFDPSEYYVKEHSNRSVTPVLKLSNKLPYCIIVRAELVNGKYSTALGKLLCIIYIHSYMYVGKMKLIHK